MGLLQRVYGPELQRLFTPSLDPESDLIIALRKLRTPDGVSVISAGAVMPSPILPQSTEWKHYMYTRATSTILPGLTSVYSLQVGLKHEVCVRRASAQSSLTVYHTPNFIVHTIRCIQCTVTRRRHCATLFQRYSSTCACPIFLSEDATRPPHSLVG